MGSTTDADGSGPSEVGFWQQESEVTVLAWEYARSSTWDPASDLPGYGFHLSVAYFFYIKTLCNHVQVSQSPNMTPITPSQPSPQRTHVLRVQLLLYIYHGHIGHGSVLRRCCALGQYTSDTSCLESLFV